MQNDKGISQEEIDLLLTAEPDEMFEKWDELLKKKQQEQETE